MFNQQNKFNIISNNSNSFTISLDELTKSLYFRVMNNSIYVSSIPQSKVTDVFNICFMVTKYGSEYWDDFRSSVMSPYDYLPYEIEAYINNNIRMWDREIKLKGLLTELNSQTSTIME